MPQSDESGRHVSPDWQRYTFDKRLREIEEIVPRLDERSLSHSKDLGTLDRKFDELLAELKPLRDALQRGRGGLAVIVFCAGIIGSVITGIIVHVLDKVTH